MKINLRIILIVFFMILSTGCDNKKEVETLNNNLESVKKELDIKINEVNSIKIEIESGKKKIEYYEKEIKILESKIKEYDMEKFILQDKLKVKENEINQMLKDNNEGIISIAGLRLDYSMKQVYEILGNNYKNDEWYDYGDTPQDKWIYEDGLEIYFNYNGQVSIIELTSPLFHTNLGFRVGDNAIEILEKCKKEFEPFISIHSTDNKSNLGWFYNKKNELIILHFNTENDRFNENIKLTENTKVEKIEVLYKFN